MGVPSRAAAACSSDDWKKASTMGATCGGSRGRGIMWYINGRRRTASPARSNLSKRTQKWALRHYEAGHLVAELEAGGLDAGVDGRDSPGRTMAWRVLRAVIPPEVLG